MSSDIPKNILSFLKRQLHAVRNLFTKKSGGAKRASSHLAMNQVLSAKKGKSFPTNAQMKHLPQLLSSKEKKLAVGALIVVIVAGAILGSRLFYAQKILSPAVGGEYTEGLIGTPQLINPLYSLTSDVDTDLARLIYSGLMRYDSEEGLVPDLAESYSISEDGLTYTFTLRNNATWHDGKPVRVTDIIFTLSAIQNIEYRSPLESSFANVSIAQIDDQTVQLTLAEPFAPFLSLLTIGILPSHIWSDIAPLNAPLSELNKKPIGSGPYTFDKLVKDSKGNVRSYTLERFANFYRGAPYVETLTFKFYTDLTSAIEALKNKNIEGLSFVPMNEIKELEKDSSISLTFPYLQQYTAAFINLSKDNALSEKSIRNALTLATNKSAIIDVVLEGRGRSIDSFILEGMIGEHGDLESVEYDLDAARIALDEAGWELVENSIVRQKDEQPLILTLATLNTMELVAAAEELKTQWSQAGIDVQINAVDSAIFQTQVLKNRDYDILLSGELYGIDPDPYAFWHSSQSEFPGLNLSGFSNRKADEFIEAGRTATSNENRAQAYIDLQEIIFGEMPAIFLYQPTYAYATSSKIQNITIGQIAIPADRFSNINEWYIKTKLRR
jgi:peptide/nickel transport system substrate-binding protein